jgi:hypothetical protein
MILAAALLSAGWLAAGCGGAVKDAVSSAAASKSVSISAPAFSPKATAPAPAPQPAASQPAVTASAVAPAQAQNSASAPASGSGSSLLWLWILLGAVAVVAGAVLIARRSGRRSAAAAGWQAQAVDAYAQGSALYDTMSIAEIPGAQANGDAQTRWADIQRRADDLNQALYTLRETAPGEAEREQTAGVLASLQAVRSAMDAERAPGGNGPAQGARVHGLLQSFAGSLRTLRSPGAPG